MRRPPAGLCGICLHRRCARDCPAREAFSAYREPLDLGELLAGAFAYYAAWAVLGFLGFLLVLVVGAIGQWVGLWS